VVTISNAAAWVLAGAVSLSAAACSDDPVRATHPEAVAAASAAPHAAGRNWVADQYIVELDPARADNVPALAKALANAPGDSVLYTYTRVMKGFAARLSSASVEGLRRNPLVARITQDEHGTPDQAAGQWGLDRIDQRYLPLNGTYAPNRDGSGVNIYVIDSGIRASHMEFGWGARVRPGYTAINDGRGTDDCAGHGTFVAAIAAGTTYGVAKNALVYPVRVANCNGALTVSGALAGMEWVATNRVLPAVVNFSNSFSRRSDIDGAATRLINAGVTFVTSAGNSNADACNYSPKQQANNIVVASTDQGDWRASDSNWGSCVDLFAPGVSISSAWIGNDTDTRVLSGTSFAAPHAAGVAALYLQGDPTANPGKVLNAVANSSTFQIVGDAKGSPNRLLYAFPFYFEVSIAGPVGYQSSGNYTWEAIPEGGDGSYTYQWSIYYHATGVDQALGTAKTQTVFLTDTTGDVSITVTSTSAGRTSSSSRYISVCGGGFC
jgi:subtilisin family serine protease